MAKKQKKTSQQVDVKSSGEKVSDLDLQHAEFIQWVNDADELTTDARALSEKSRDYYDSKQWTAEEKNALRERKQAATVINRIKPKMDGLMGLEKSNRTTVRAFPRTPKHEADATAATEAIRYVLQAQSWNKKRSAAWENLLMEGTGGVEVIAKPAKDGEVTITLNNIPWDRMIFDPRSMRKDFSDARYLGQVVWMDYDEALALYPNAKDILETMQEGSETYEDKPKWMDDSRKRCKIVELYYKKAGEVYYACFTRGGFCEEPKKSPYKTDTGEAEWPYEFGSLFIDRDNNRYGACVQLLDIQDEINKRRSKALHLMSVRQVAVQRGAVEDVNKLRSELSKPDGVVELDQPVGESFEILKTGDMAQAQFNLLAEAKGEIDSVSYSAAMSGKENRNMSGVALRSREMAGQTENAPMFEVLRDIDYRVYRKIWNRIRQYWTGEKWVRVTDDQNNLKWVGLNRKMTVGQQMLAQAEQQGAPREMLQQMQMRAMQDPSMQAMVTENNIAELDVDLILTDAPDTVSQQVEDFQTIGEMVKSGFPMPPMAVIEASPLSNKERILKMMKEAPQIPPQAQQQMEQMKQQAQDMQGQLQQAMQENQQLKADMMVQMNKIRAESQTKSQELNQKAQLAEAEMLLDKQIEIDKALMQIQSMISKHESKMQMMVDSMLMKQEAKRQAEETAEAEAEETAEKESEAQMQNATLSAMQQQHEQFMQGIAQIMQTLNAKKQINLIKQNGQTVGAEVVPMAGNGTVQ
jgi:hypothetical protein